MKKVITVCDFCLLDLAGQPYINVMGDVTFQPEGAGSIPIAGTDSQWHIRHFIEKVRQVSGNP